MKTNAFLVFAVSCPRMKSESVFTKADTIAVTSRSPILVIVCALSLLLIPYSQAAVVKLVSPQDYESMEGELSVDETCCGPFRYQQIFPADDFAALGGQPHWITSITVRPDQRLGSPRTATIPDQQIRLSTTTQSPENLSSRFDDNFGPDVTQVYRGPVTLVADAETLTSVPRGFYRTSYPQEPFLYDPSKGNLLLDFMAGEGCPLRRSKIKPAA